MKEAKTIAICNQKGGVGKSNVTVNLGIGLTNQGKKVLTLDTDPQGDLTTSLGWRDTEKLDITTVSYTHLDVYKRQHSGHGVFAFQ